LIHLKKLNLAANQLGRFPSVLKKLSQLEELDLSSNGLKTLSSEIKYLNQLKRLSLSLKESLFAHQYTMYDRHYPLKKLSFYSPFSKKNNIIKNKLSNFLKNYYKKNYLQTLPSEIGELKRLQKFDLSYNKLEKLPNEIRKLNNLKYLNLKYNKLKEKNKIKKLLPNCEIIF